MVIVGMRFALSDYGWCWLVIRIPLVGPMLLWRGVADWSRLAALLLEQGLSLPEALGLAATGTRDPFIAAQGTVDCPVGRYGNQAGGHLELGTRNAEIAGAACQLGRNARCAPRCISHGGGNVRKSSAIASALLQSILPPIAFIVVLLTAFWLVSALLGPLVHLIVDLSAGGASKK